MTKKGKPKRSSRRPVGLVDYVLVLEDGAGRQLAMAMQKDSRAPIIGEEVPLQERAAKEVPHLAGTCVVHRVAHLAPPNATVTIERYTIPWCYARRHGETSAPTLSGAAHHAGVGVVAAADATFDDATAAEFAEKSRGIATDLSDIAEEIAAKVHSGEAGTIRADLAQRVDEASRKAKQLSVSALAKTRIRRESE